MKALGVRVLDELPADLAKAKVAIDFSRPDLSLRALNVCRAAHVPIVIGTTGHGAEFDARVAAASRDIAVLVAPNTSIGVAVAQELVRIAARTLPAEFDIEISEAHHKHKLDAPSGTALALAAERGRGARTRSQRRHAFRAIRAGRAARRRNRHRQHSCRRYRGYPYSAVRRAWRASDGGTRGHRPVDLCKWRDQGGGLARGAKARPIHDGKRTWIKNNRLEGFSVRFIRTFRRAFLHETGKKFRGHPGARFVKLPPNPKRVSPTQGGRMFARTPPALCMYAPRREHPLN